MAKMELANRLDKEVKVYVAALLKSPTPCEEFYVNQFEIDPIGGILQKLTA